MAHTPEQIEAARVLRDGALQALCANETIAWPELDAIARIYWIKLAERVSAPLVKAERERIVAMLRADAEKFVDIAKSAWARGIADKIEAEK